MGWLIAEYDADFHGHRGDLQSWFQELGILDVTRDCMDCLAITGSGSDKYELHLTKCLRNDDGEFYIDYARNQVVSEPVVIPIQKKSWPSWLNGMRRPATPWR